MQLEQVVTEAHDCPFGGGLGEPAQTESSEAHGLFDLAEHRLDHHLALKRAWGEVAPRAIVEGTSCGPGGCD